MFELKVGEETIKLKWGTYAMRLFTDKAGTGVDHFFETVQKFAAGNYTQDGALRAVEGFIHAGYEYGNGSKATDLQVCEWIDNVGGIFKMQMSGGPLIEYINYIVGVTMNGVTMNGEGGVEKKTEVAEVGMTSS